jgi:hypothetical protein
MSDCGQIERSVGASVSDAKIRTPRDSYRQRNDQNDEKQNIWRDQNLFHGDDYYVLRQHEGRETYAHRPNSFMVCSTFSPRESSLNIKP